MQECRSAGVLECSSAGVQECRSAGVQKCRSAGMVRAWHLSSVYLVCSSVVQTPCGLSPLVARWIWNLSPPKAAASALSHASTMALEGREPCRSVAGFLSAVARSSDVLPQSAHASGSDDAMRA